MHTDTNEVQILARKAFPHYTGCKFQVRPFHGPKRLTSYWDGGSRDYYNFVRLDNGQTQSVPENGTPFSTEIDELNELPLNVALVQHRISCGKDAGITIFVNENNLSKLLPPVAEITDDERSVLNATRSYKASYGGDKYYRQKQSGLSLEAWHAAKAECIAKGLLNKAGAITNDGRNAIERR